MNKESVAYSIIRQRIQLLLDEAATTGDLAQVYVCRKALDGDILAWESCLDVFTHKTNQEN